MSGWEPTFLNGGADFLNDFHIPLQAEEIRLVNINNELFLAQCVSQRACSRVCEFLEVQASNSPTPAASIRIVQSP